MTRRSAACSATDTKNSVVRAVDLSARQSGAPVGGLPRLQGMQRVFSVLCGFAALSGARGDPGDCTSEEAAAYREDPRATVVDTPAQCVPLDASSAADTALCEAIDETHPVPQHERDSCFLVPSSDESDGACGSDRLTVWNATATALPPLADGCACGFLNAVTHRELSPAFLATKRSATALSSAACATCASDFAPAAECEPSADASCQHGNGIWNACVGSNPSSAAELTGEEGKRMAYKAFRDCVRADSLQSCQDAVHRGVGPHCVWDGSQPAGRRCTVKPQLFVVLQNMIACNAQAPATESDCSQAPWCEYQPATTDPATGDMTAPRCSARDVDGADGSPGFESELITVAAAASNDVTPEPSDLQPPQSPSPVASSASAHFATGLGSILRWVLAGALATVSLHM